MSVFARIEADLLEARKSRDSNRLSVLTLLVSKIQRIAKDDGNRPVSETEEKNDVIQGITRYRKEVEEMRLALTNAGRSTEDQDFELEVVSAYLPKQMTAEELDAEIEKALEGTDRTNKAMGKVMAHLNSNFRGQFDGKAASAAVKAKLS